MKMDQSGTRSREIYKSAPIRLGEAHFPFLVIVITAPGSRAEQAKQSTVEQSRVELFSRTGVLPKGHLTVTVVEQCSTTMLFHNRAIKLKEENP